MTNEKVKISKYRALKLYLVRSYVFTWKLKISKKLSDLLKQQNNSKDHQETIVLYLIRELHKSTSKDIVRKLIIRCINTITRTKLIDENLNKLLKNELFHFLSSKTNSIGQKLFILNVYLENLDQFGNKINIINKIIFFFDLLIIF